MKFLVPNYSCLQNPLLGGCRPPDPIYLCPLSSTEFVEPPRTKFLGTPLINGTEIGWKCMWLGVMTLGDKRFRKMLTLK